MAMTKDSNTTYRLKPGNHAFVPGGPAIHNNSNTGADALNWYIGQYPYVRALCMPADDAPTEQEPQVNNE